MNESSSAASAPARTFPCLESLWSRPRWAIWSEGPRCRRLANPGKGTQEKELKH